MTKDPIAAPEHEKVPKSAVAVEADADKNSQAGRSGRINASVDDHLLSTNSQGLPTSHGRTSLSQSATDSTTLPSTVNMAASAAANFAVPSPYGTRSRNRTGASRPNYAEDKETDMDFEYQHPTKVDGSSSKSSASLTPAVTNGTDTTRTAQIRRSTGGENDHTNAQSQSRDQIPGTSSFSVTTSGSSQPSKKRKTGQHSTPSFKAEEQTTATTAPKTRRASLAGHCMNRGLGDSNMLTFDQSGACLQNDKLIADDGTVMAVNDHIYLVCEPPGEPYYLGRIMEFLHADKDADRPVEALRINWYYRPKDIGRKVNDTRQVFASMHSDVSPLTSLRGKCQIKHRSEVDNLDELKKVKDCFWYEKLYDRYIHRYYEVIPTRKVVNVPAKVKSVLHERWDYILVESGRGKELTSAVKTCRRCSGYCASNDSVDCAVCHNTYHMNCVRPPLLKKPSRGFAWACGPCSRAQEKKLEARNIPNVVDVTLEGDEEEIIDEEEEDLGLIDDDTDNGGTKSTQSSDASIAVHPGTAEQIHQASLWPYRYLGIHCKVEDALDYDDRIYPRASSRLGTRHQANVNLWHGRPVEMVKPADIKRRYIKGGHHRKDAKLSKETIAALDADKLAREARPKWVMDEPPGYVHRGEDSEELGITAEPQFIFPGPGVMSTDRGDGNNREESTILRREQLLDDYVDKAKGLAKHLGVDKCSTNLIDTALSILYVCKYDVDAALEELASADKWVLKEPDLTTGELKRFEDGVTKYGSELHNVKKYVKTVNSASIVRYYYTWKKTDRGKAVWGGYSGRKGKKEAKKAEASTGKLQDDVADDQDDSAFDNDKASEKKRGFECKFCQTRTSRQWRRAPNTAAGTTVSADANGTKNPSKDKSVQLMVALCRRCAELWRRYGIQWEDVDEVQRKAAQAGGRSGRRKVDDELLQELTMANEVTNIAPPIKDETQVAEAQVTSGASQDTSRRKAKSSQIAVAEKEVPPLVESVPPATVTSRKKIVEKPPPPLPPPPPPVPEIPKPRVLPCAICMQMEPIGEQHISCKECRMTVHRNCYGIVADTRGKWSCDMCSNDKNPQVSISYQCMLCPVRYTEQDFVEPPKSTNRKKSEKDREKDRAEREIAQKAADFYAKRQEELNRPLNPREPLKRTANNNWVHVTCAVWTSEVKFGNAKALEPSEGIPSIPSARYDETCKICNTSNGACVACHVCRAAVHVECAHQNDYILGFDIVPVKGSRRDQFNIVNVNGEVGTMVAAVWCPDHMPTKTIVHRMHDVVDETGLNALQLFVRNFKQADLTLTGTVRKATLVNQSTRVLVPGTAISVAHRRAPAPTANGNATGRSSVAPIKTDEGGIASLADFSPLPDNETKVCATCNVNVSPKWWPYLPASKMANGTTTSRLNSPLPVANIENDIKHPLTNGHVAGSDENPSTVGQAMLAAALVESSNAILSHSRQFQCHKCHWKSTKEPPHPPTPSSAPTPVFAPALAPAPAPIVATPIASAAPTAPTTPAAPAALAAPAASITADRAISIPREAPRVDSINQASATRSPAQPITAPAPAPAPPPPPPPPQYPTWSGIAYQPSTYNDWPRPQQMAHPVSHGNGALGVHTSPVRPVAHLHQAFIQTNGAPHPPHMRRSSTEISRSPSGQHQSNLVGPPPLSLNGYAPRQPISGVVGGTAGSPGKPQPTNATPFTGFTRPPLSHLASGPPPPSQLAPEAFGGGHGSAHLQAPFGVSHASPPRTREAMLSREQIGQQQQQQQHTNGVRVSDGRVNGGASASPSLRNLLS